MIAFSELLYGGTTVSRALRESHALEKLHFSSGERPVVVWNITKRCNLRCPHCYSGTESRFQRSELTTEEARRVIADLAEMKVPVVLFSGGEPLLRSDLFLLAREAVDRGLRAVLSTNGTPLTVKAVGQIKDAGFQYVGVSLDGTSQTNDLFRNRQGAFDAAVRGIRRCQDSGIKVGLRFTLCAENFDDLPGILELVEELKIPRFCMYHLVYAGRGRMMVQSDVAPQQRRRAVEILIERALDWRRRNLEIEILTADQYADGAYIHRYLLRHDPARADVVLRLLQMHGGCSAGCKIASIDPYGDVHPCQFWEHMTLGNVRARTFRDIWEDKGSVMLQQLRRKSELVKGRCGACAYKTVCAGCRVRAESVNGDIWAEDPACYLFSEEILSSARSSSPISTALEEARFAKSDG